MARRSSFTLSSAFPPPPSSVALEERRSSRVPSRTAHRAKVWSKEEEQEMDWESRGVFGTSAETLGRLDDPQHHDREAVLLKRWDVRDLDLVGECLPSPPASPPQLYPVAHYQTLEQLHPHTSTSQSPLFVFKGRDTSAATIADQRRSRSRLPLTPPSDPSPLLHSTHVASSTNASRSHPPPSLLARNSSRPSLTPSSSNSTVASKRSSLIKRKPVPQYEEEVDSVDDPLWDPTSPKPERSAVDVAGSVVGQMRRLSVDERGSPETRPGLGINTRGLSLDSSRSAKALPNWTGRPRGEMERGLSASSRISSVKSSLHDPVDSEGGERDSYPQGALSRNPSILFRRFSSDTDEHSLRSSSSRTGPPSTTPTSPSLEGHAPPSSASSSSLPFPSRPTSRRQPRPFALIRRREAKPTAALATVIPSLARPFSTTRISKHDELDAWMAIMGPRDHDEGTQETAPSPFARPIRPRTTEEQATWTSSRLSFSDRRMSEGRAPLDPLFTSVPPLVYSSSSSSSREGSFITRPCSEAVPARMRGTSPFAKDSSGAEGEDEWDGSAEGSTEGSVSSSSMEDYVDAWSSRRPSLSSLSSSHTDGSQLEILDGDHQGQVLASMEEVDEPITPNPNHFIACTPKVTRPPSPSPVTSSPAAQVAAASLFGAFTWSPESPSASSTSPITSSSFTLRTDSPSPSSSSSVPSESKRRPSQTPRPPKPPKSPRRASRSAGVSLTAIEGMQGAGVVQQGGSVAVC